MQYSKKELIKLYGELRKLTKEQKSELLTKGFHYRASMDGVDTEDHSYTLGYMVESEVGCENFKKIVAKLAEFGYEPRVGVDVESAKPVSVDELISGIQEERISANDDEWDDCEFCWFCLRDGLDVPDVFEDAGENEDGTIININDLFRVVYYTGEDATQRLGDVYCMSGGDGIFMSEEDVLNDPVLETFREAVDGTLLLADVSPVVGYDMRIIGDFVSEYSEAVEEDYDEERINLYIGDGDADDTGILSKFCPNLLTEGNWSCKNVSESFKGISKVARVLDSDNEALPEALLHVYMDGDTPKVACLNGIFGGWEKGELFKIIGSTSKTVTYAGGVANAYVEYILKEFGSKVHDCYIVLVGGKLQNGKAFKAASGVAGESTYTVC